MLNNLNASILNENSFSLLNMSLLSERIKEAMGHCGIKGAELAAACGVTAGSISQWRSGLIKNLDAVSCIRAAQAMGVSALWLADGTGKMLDNGIAQPVASPAVMPLIEKIIRLDHDQLITPNETKALLVFIEAIEGCHGKKKHSVAKNAKSMEAANSAIKSAGGKLEQHLKNSSDILKTAAPGYTNPDVDMSTLLAAAGETNKKSPL
jgi:transcriptional regulator with XRE-family HTH domain